MTAREMGTGLVRASHPLPTVAVTALTAGLVLGAGATWAPGLLVVAAVLTGQLVIGWSNDLIDAERDRSVGRVDKPVARGVVDVRTVRWALALAAVATVTLSLAVSLAAAALHLMLVVGSGLAYNAGLKATAWSWVPYAVAFGALPAVAWVGAGSGAPPWWAVVVGALLGVGAHLLNVLPDLADDEQTGVRGLPHRLGERPTRFVAPLLLLTGSVIVVLAPPGGPSWWSAAVLLACVALAALAWRARGTTPFVAAIALAVINVIALVVG
ncbi:UbiA family prenyltransferase [Ornithinimicrobium cryptoxanthini]|uniref:UbiA family prenyltransferase n=1 Tax=Ornithinimicrobium cryptoxanthini TaxID=2934161 RepID=A0ABY4YM22_9MICO|nr:UbiA family prenyltransferase [Ornithinimicrobium cryptoxanthini]USQ77315.1 UbiA family prenyltransferase [Ornithinimicrobium cryptoxanthini]